MPATLLAPCATHTQVKGSQRIHQITAFDFCFLPLNFLLIMMCLFSTIHKETKSRPIFFATFPILFRRQITSFSDIDVLMSLNRRKSCKTQFTEYRPVIWVLQYRLTDEIIIQFLWWLQFEVLSAQSQGCFYAYILQNIH